MKKKVVISGGSGMIGMALSKLLLKLGYEVAHISRSKESKIKGIKVIVWDIEKQQLAEDELQDFDYIIHLAGANIFLTPWNKKGKKEILNSRIDSAELLFHTVEKLQIKPKAIISASAVGYYGLDTSKHIFTEEDKAGNGFLAECCVEWEKSIEKFSSLGIRNIQLRQGVVLSAKSKIIKLLIFTIKAGLGAIIGKGDQYIPCIHLEDLCRLYLHCLQKEDLQGSYNAVSFNPSNEEFTRSMAKAYHRKIFLPKIPASIVQFLLGKKAKLLLEGSRISSEKIKKSGFEFKQLSLWGNCIDQTS